MLVPVTFVLALATSDAPAPELEAKVKDIFEEYCTVCHDDSGEPDEPAGLNLEVAPGTLVGKSSIATGKPLVAPGNPDGSYLVAKLLGEGIKGDSMPQGDDPLGDAELDAVRQWIASLEGDGGTGTGGTGTGDTGTGTSVGVGATGGTTDTKRKRKGKDPFHGTHQIWLPTTATLGKLTLQYRIDHRFGRIGTERGAFGLDAGVLMSMGLAFGIFDGWDVLLRRTNSRKGYELGTKYIPIRQEAGKPVSFGGYASLEGYRDFDVEHAVTGNFMAMVSRLWFERWSTMLTLGYHLRTNHNTRVLVDLGDGPELVEDKRDTMTMGLASTVWLGKKKRWGIDGEYVLPIPDGANPNVFYYRGGDADPSGSKIGAWALGGSYRVGLHFFQVFLTNNREIHTNLAAPGGQSGNPFKTEGVDSKNPFHKFNFFLGFNLARKFKF